ncbi:hypothetical protein BDN72DRAFT_594342 [Pluteus cervinus]|uniref:Uncharacterized protein n=1 Tax=Pluteus cervinus TaxID=181527 RepID=A0ACD3A1H4_9AGAR|nr:hypothetical protein BDN72DRAFT_594342 [Pluteus cervinus]
MNAEFESLHQRSHFSVVCGTPTLSEPKARSQSEIVSTCPANRATKYLLVQSLVLDRTTTGRHSGSMGNFLFRIGINERDNIIGVTTHPFSLLRFCRLLWLARGRLAPLVIWKSGGYLTTMTCSWHIHDRFCMAFILGEMSNEVGTRRRLWSSQE